MGLGFFFRYFFLDSRNIVSSLFITGLIFISSFTLFPLLSITNVITSGNAEVISIVLLLIYGFFQMNCWPVSLQLVNDYYTNDSEGSIIGFWSEAGSFGNIIGFLFPSLLIVNAHLPWQVPLIIMAAILFLSTIFIYLFVKRKK
jgi:sugar phosphate permease